MSDIDSSLLSFVHYHNNSQYGWLGVTFQTGDSYIYGNVPMKDVLNMLDAESMGSFFSKNIKNQYYYKSAGRVESGSPLAKIGIKYDE